MSVVKLEETTGIGALALMQAVEAVARSGQLVQVRALVVERQPYVADFVADERQAGALKDQQAQLRAQAGACLNELVPAVIGGIAELQQAAALLHAIKGEAEGAGAALDADAARALVGAVRDAAEAGRDHGQQLKAQAGRILQAVRPTVDSIEADFAAYADTLADDDGEIERLKTEIDEVSAGMTAAVQATVDAGKDIGKGAKKIVTWFTSLFSFAEPEAPESPEPEPVRKPPKDKDATSATADDDEPAGGHAAGERDAARGKSRETDKPGKAGKPVKPARPRIVPSKSDKPFPAETIGEISDKTTGIVDARSDLNRLATRLQELYQLMYLAERALGVIGVVRRQGADLLAALQAADAAATALAAAWVDLAAKCADAAERGVVPIDASWQRLGARVDVLSRAYVEVPADMPRLNLANPFVS